MAMTSNDRILLPRGSELAEAEMERASAAGTTRPDRTEQ